MQVPSQINRTGSADVEIQIKTSDGTTLSGHTSESIPVSQLEDVTFVQTDKQEYKPGDVLKIRIFVLNKDFLAGNEQKVVWNKSLSRTKRFHLRFPWLK